jgi:nuclear pore complex protein Nup133
LLPANGNTNAITLGATTATGIDVWALVETRVQKWNMSTEGWEEIVLDQDIGGIIRPVIRETHPSAPLDDSSLDLELLDFAFEKHSLVNANLGRMVILISYAGKEDSMGITTADPRRVYALVWVSYSSGAFSVENVSIVPYQSVCIPFYRMFMN